MERLTNPADVAYSEGAAQNLTQLDWSGDEGVTDKSTPVRSLFLPRSITTAQTQAPCNPAPGRQQGIDLGALFENVKDIYESSEPGLRERAIEEQFRELGIWFQRRTPRGRIDNYVGTAINASPWQLGALPQWLLVPYMIQMRDFLAARRDIIDMSPRMIGEKLLSEMEDGLRALSHLHRLRNFDMEPDVEHSLWRFTCRLVQEELRFVQRVMSQYPETPVRRRWRRA